MRTIAYLGPEKTYTHLAAKTRFGQKCHYVHAPTVEDVFGRVERRQADYGVVPIENSLGGAVTHTLDRFIDFLDTPIRIHGEIEQPIQHHLILHHKATLADIRVVYSHPQAFTQCHGWLGRYLSRVFRWETNSTAEALEYLKDKSLGSRVHSLRERAAIGMKELAKPPLRALSIPQGQENKTRFLILGLGQIPKGRRNKTSLMCSLKDRPGALYDALAPFKRHQINLTKIESRPSKRRAWEYLFFIDFEGHTSEARVQKALSVLEETTLLLKVLGSYPINS